jgi:hypothetical protein
VNRACAFKYALVLARIREFGMWARGLWNPGDGEVVADLMGSRSLAVEG